MRHQGVRSLGFRVRGLGVQVQGGSCEGSGFGVWL